MRRFLLAFLFFPLLSLGMSSPASAQEHPVLTRLHLRDRVVVIESGQDSALYTITTEDGKTLDVKLNETELQAKHPEIYESVQPAIAKPDSTLMMLDVRQFR
jgi:hypothetical protein